MKTHIKYLYAGLIAAFIFDPAYFDLVKSSELVSIVRQLYLLFIFAALLFLYSLRSSLLVSRGGAGIFSFFTFLLIYSFASIFWSISPKESLTFSLLLIVPPLLILCSRGYEVFLLRVAVTTASVLVILSAFSLFLDLLVGGYTLSDYFSEVYSIPSFFMVPPLVVIVVVGFAVSKGFFKRPFRYLLLSCSFFVLVQFPSKSYFLGGGVAVFYALVYVRYGFRAGMLSAVFGVVLLGALLSTDNFLSRSFLYKPGESSDLSVQNVNTSGRLNTWMFVARRTKTSPGGVILGGGIGTSDYLMRKFYKRGESVHSEYLRVYSELGLVGVCIIYFSIFYFILTSRKLGASSLESRAILVGVLTVLFAYLLCGVTYVLSNSPLPIFVTLCLSVSLLNQRFRAVYE